MKSTTSTIRKPVFLALGLVAGLVIVGLWLMNPGTRDTDSGVRPVGVA